MMDRPKYHIDIFWSDEDGGYIANVPDLRYCSAFGETYEEALREVLVAMELHLDTLQELDRPTPEPASRGVSEVAIHEGSYGRDTPVVENVGEALNEAYRAAVEDAFENWAETLEHQTELSRRTLQNLNKLVEEQRQMLREGSPEATEPPKRKAEG
jgi:predicted RNase H-like HicB family nuclease